VYEIRKRSEPSVLPPEDAWDEFDLRELVNAAVQSSAAIARVKRLELNRIVGANIPRRLYGRAVAMRKILTALVANAVRFTESGEVTLCADLDHETSTEVTLRFVVRDTSGGITPETLSEFFDRFSLAHDLHVGDTPRGLQRCQDLITSIGGQINVDKHAGSGSTLHFIVCVDKAEAPASRTLH